LVEDSSLNDAVFSCIRECYHAPICGSGTTGNQPDKLRRLELFDSVAVTAALSPLHGMVSA
jgi:hypothetical protein